MPSLDAQLFGINAWLLLAIITWLPAGFMATRLFWFLSEAPETLGHKLLFLLGVVGGWVTVTFSFYFFVAGTAISVVLWLYTRSRIFRFFVRALLAIPKFLIRLLAAIANVFAQPLGALLSLIVKATYRSKKN